MKNNLEKIVIASGIGRLRQQASFEEKILPEIMKEMTMIAGQYPAIRKAIQSIAGFKIRSGDAVGLQITLRGKRMSDFLNKFVNAVLPRIKDFRGIDQKNVDGRGNLNIGLRDQFSFPEIEAEQSKVNFGLQITIVPKNKKREEAVDLYKKIGIPLKNG